MKNRRLHRPSSLLLWWCFCLASFCLYDGSLPLLQGVAAAAEDDDQGVVPPLLWASTGGGWRAMFAGMGYANVFHQAGLLTHNASRFTGVVRTCYDIVDDIYPYCTVLYCRANKQSS